MAVIQRLQNELVQIEAKNRLRSLHLPNGVDFTSNDYLGMAQHSALKAKALEALQSDMDIGAAGSRLLRGHTKAHENLEDFASGHFKAGKTLYFSSGFQANYAIFTTLPSRHDVVLYDSLVHASVRGGIKASDAKGYKFAHNDLNALEALLKKCREKAENIWIAVESVYSMDGDLAPLEALYTLARQYNAVLIVDEAHGTGVFGENGKGLCWQIIQKYGYEGLVTLHTCGKAIGVVGGLVCADAQVIDYMVNCARAFIYTTAPMPLQAFLVQKSLELLAGNEGQVLRERLFHLNKAAKNLFGGAGTQIIPIILGEDKKAVCIAKEMQSKGFDVRAVRPPTVPENSARLRISLGVHLEESILQCFANELRFCMEQRESA